MRELERILLESNGQARVYEFGSGYSTRWLASRSGTVVSIESDTTWYSTVVELLNGLSNAEVRLVPPSADIGETRTDCFRSEVQIGCFDEYVRSIDRFPDNAFDLVIVDGFSRNAALKYAQTKVKPGGYVFLDDAQRSRYSEGLALYQSWTSTRVEGIRPRSLPNTAVILRRPA